MRLIATAAFAAIFAVSATAQHFNGQYVLGGSSIQVLDDKGTFTTIFNNPGSAQGITMDIDNKHVIYGEGTTMGWLRIDPSAPGTPTTIVVDANTYDYPTEIIPDQDGNFIVAASNANFDYGLYKLMNTTTTTITTTVQMGIAGTFTCGITRDIDDGNFVLGMYSASGPWPIVSIAPDGTFTTIIANYTTLGAPRYQLAQDIRKGDFYLGGQDANQGFLVRIQKGGPATTVATSTDRYAWNVIAADRASAANPRLIHPYRGNLYFTDLKVFSVTTVVVNGTSVSPRSITVKDGLNIQTVLTGVREWDVRFSFKSHPGKSYGAGITISGVRPGLPIKDGRNILFNLDQVGILSIQGLLKPFFNAGPNILDVNGEAVGKMNLKLLPTRLGVTAHILAVVLDPNAPSGIAVISNPYVMSL